MDAEKFDKVVLDLLYDELDELTRASAIRHTEQSGRAKALYAELRATREVGSLPLVEPAEDLEARILAAEELARAGRPLRQRLGTLVSIAASYAMRPQLGMAAVLLLMVGSSLLLLRVKPGEPRSVQVTERGVPESDKESVAVVPVTPAPAPLRDEEAASPPRPQPAARARADVPRGEAADDAKEKVAMEAPTDLGQGNRAFAPAPPEALAQGSLGAGAPGASLDRMTAGGAPEHSGPAAFGAAKKDEESAGADTPSPGCEASLPRYEALLLHPPSAATANAVRWAAAECYVELGRIDRARRSYTALLAVPAYADRAERALAELSPHATATPNASAAPAEPAKPAPSDAPPAARSP